MKRFFILIATLSLVCLTSCVRDVVLDAGENPQVVVDCFLSNDDVQKLYICFTKGVSRDEADPLTEAVATLIDLTESKTVGQFVKGEEKNLWTLDYSALPQHHYRLEVQVPGYDLIYAEDTMPESVHVYSSTQPYLTIQGGIILRPTDNFYFAGTAFNFVDLPKYTLIYGMNYNPQTGRHEIADEIFTNLPFVDNFNITNEVYVPEIVKCEDLDVSCDAVRSLYVELKGVPKHKQYLLLNKEELSDYLFQFINYFEPFQFYYLPFQVFGSFTGDWFWDTIYNDLYYVKKPLPTEGYLVFESLSDNYLAYIRDAIHFMQMKESSDMSSIYLRDNLYTNVVGGLGIFAASSKQIQQCANKFSTGILEERFSEYGIIAEDHGYRFADNERYEYPLYKPEN